VERLGICRTEKCARFAKERDIPPNRTPRTNEVKGMYDEEFEKKLIKALEKTNKKCHENFDLAKGSRGSTNNPSCNFYMGAYAILEDVIDAIKTRKTTTLEQWGK